MKNKNQTKENWEKEFEEKFAINIGRNWFFTEDEAKELKSFIRQLLKSEKEKNRQKFIETIEDVCKGLPFIQRQLKEAIKDEK